MTNSVSGDGSDNTNNAQGIAADQGYKNLIDMLSSLEKREQQFITANYLSQIKGRLERLLAFVKPENKPAAEQALAKFKEKYNIVDQAPEEKKTEAEEPVANNPEQQPAAQAEEKKTPQPIMPNALPNVEPEPDESYKNFLAMIEVCKNQDKDYIQLIYSPILQKVLNQALSNVSVPNRPTAFRALIDFKQSIPRPSRNDDMAAVAADEHNEPSSNQQAEPSTEQTRADKQRVSETENFYTAIYNIYTTCEILKNEPTDSLNAISHARDEYISSRIGFDEFSAKVSSVIGNLKQDFITAHQQGSDRRLTEWIKNILENPESGNIIKDAYDEHAAKTIDFAEFLAKIRPAIEQYEQDQWNTLDTQIDNLKAHFNIIKNPATNRYGQAAQDRRSDEIMAIVADLNTVKANITDQAVINPLEDINNEYISGNIDRDRYAERVRELAVNLSEAGVDGAVSLIEQIDIFNNLQAAQQQVRVEENPFDDGAGVGGFLEDDLARAIELSLEEGTPPRSQLPSFSTTPAYTEQPVIPVDEPRAGLYSSKNLGNMIQELMNRIANKESGRKTSGLNSPKWKAFNSIKNAVNAHQGDFDPATLQGYLSNIEELCTEKRHFWHFWAVPHSVNDFTELKQRYHYDQLPPAAPSI
ncbi:hypothetical protein ACFORL_06595 [Legionella dresdenensis]|uniref:Uncharacterized protein n=1 Tax=Legionella dresdenensis TaxID=450200 RepID=A0ABV8CF09_9GAMM